MLYILSSMPNILLSIKLGILLNTEQSHSLFAHVVYCVWRTHEKLHCSILGPCGT